MRDDLIKGWFGDGEDPARLDPVRAARAALKPKLPKRFYTEVTTGKRDVGHVLLLDGRPARTRLRQLFCAETVAAAGLLVAEWAAQGDFIVPSTMPVTRMVNAAIDHVAGARSEVVADILNYARSDLVCYRASEPERLAALQARHWDPVLTHIEAAYGARFVLIEGIGFVEQAPSAIEALRAPVQAHRSAAALAALHVLTTISGSALIALSVADRTLSGEAGFDAGEVDADFEISVWGSDEEAMQRRSLRRADFLAAAALLHALEG